MREEPGAAESEPGDLTGGEEARKAGVGVWGGGGREKGRHACGEGTWSSRGGRVLIRMMAIV